MVDKLKVYLFGVLGAAVGVLAVLLQSEKLKAKTKALKVANKTAQINHDVAKILANRNVREVLDGIDQEVAKGNVTRLDR